MTAAADVAGTLELLATLYGELAAKKTYSGEESRLANTFSTLLCSAEKVVELLSEADTY